MSTRPSRDRHAHVDLHRRDQQEPPQRGLHADLPASQSAATTDTLLRLNGEVRSDHAIPLDDTYLEFTDLHEVHDNRYGEGLNTMWIYLEPEYDYLLAQGVCVSP